MIYVGLDLLAVPLCFTVPEPRNIKNNSLDDWREWDGVHGRMSLDWPACYTIQYPINIIISNKQRSPPQKKQNQAHSSDTLFFLHVDCENYKTHSGNSKVTSFPVSFLYTAEKVSTCNTPNHWVNTVHRPRWKDETCTLTSFKQECTHDTCEHTTHTDMHAQCASVEDHFQVEICTDMETFAATTTPWL